MIVQRGSLIALSGIDGAGKSTQVELLRAALAELMPPVKKVKTVLHATRGMFALAADLTGDPQGYHPVIPATLREFAIACDVLAFSEQVLRPAAEQGVTLVWDRSPLCYEAYGRYYGADPRWSRKALELVRKPDLTVLLDVDAALAVKRLASRREKPQLSSENLDLLRGVREIYRELAADRPGVLTVDGSRPPAEIAVFILTEVRRWLER